MSNKILYNNIDIFSGIAPTPFVTFSQEFTDFGTKWNQVSTITLEGQLTGKYLGTYSYQYLNESLKKLLSGFNQNYKSLVILSGNAPIFSGNPVIINSINIDESPWYGILPFNIDITYYNSGLFSDYYGITEPEENISYSEENGDIVSLNHSISAKGIQTLDANAIENAKNWVTSRTGNFNKITPILIKNNSSKNFIPIKINETIDRFNGVYSWQGEYRKNINIESPSNAFLNYTVDISSGYEDGFINGSIQGTLNGNNITGLRIEYNKLNLHSICNRAALDIYNVPLSSRAINQSVNELENKNTISFNASFNNDYGSDIINNFSVDLNQDISTCITNINFRADITAKYGDISGRWQKVKNFYDTQFYPIQYVISEYQKEIGDPSNLNYNSLSESLIFDESNAKIVYSATYNDKKTSYNSDILNLSSTVNYVPAVRIHTAKSAAFWRRYHNVQNINCSNRSIVKFTVTAIAKINSSITVAEREVRSEINRLINNYVVGNNPFREEQTVSRNNDIKTVTINETWSFEGAIIS